MEILKNKNEIETENTDVLIRKILGFSSKCSVVFETDICMSNEDTDCLQDH